MLRDEEHNAWTLKIDDRASGYSRTDLIGPEFVTSGEFRTLVGSYAEVSAIVRAMRKGPIEVRVSDGLKAAAEEAEEAEQAGELTADEKDALGAIGLTPTTPRRPQPRRRRTARCRPHYRRVHRSLHRARPQGCGDQSLQGPW